MTVRRSPLVPPLPLLAGILLILAAALLYAATLDNGFRYGELDGGDLITHQYAQVQGRPGNAPGYPLYTMGGWLWFHTLRPALAALRGTPPNPIPILSSYSTLWALLALWLLYQCIRFVTSTRYRAHSAWGADGNWPLAWLLGAFYAVTSFFWYYATTTEQYTSAIAQTLAIVYLYLLWSEADAEAGVGGYYGVRSRPGGLLVALALLCGAALAHMLTVALIVPPLAAAILWQRPGLRRRGGLLLALIAAALAPLLGYLYVYVRGAAHPEWWGSIPFASAGDWFWFFVSTSQGRDELGWGFEPGAAFFANGFPRMIWDELGLLLPVGLGGLLLLRRGERLLLGGTLALYLVFCWAYRYGNWFQVILPVYPLLLIGAAALLDRVQHAPLLQGRAWGRALPLVVVAALAGVRAAATLPQADNRNRAEDVALDRAAILIEGAPEGAALFAPVGEALALDYLTSIWGVRAGAQVVSADKAADALEQGRPLLATWEALPTLLAEARLEADTLIQAHSPDWAQLGGAQRAAPAQAQVIPLLEGVALAGIATAAAPTGRPIVDAPPKALDVSLWWRIDGSWPEGVSISVRALKGDAYLRLADGTLVQQDTTAPLRGFLTRAPDGAPVADAYRLVLPGLLQTEVDGIEVLLYSADGPLASARLPLRQ